MGENYTGPFKVIQQYGQVNYILRKSIKTKPFVAHVDKMKLCLSEGQDLSREDARNDTQYARKDARVSAYGVPATATADEDASVNWREDETRNRPRSSARKPARYEN